MLMRKLCVGAIALTAVVGLSRTGLADPVMGTTGGVFVNPTPPSATTTGVGTNEFTWGVGQPPPPSKLTFNGVGFNTTTETDFNLGTLTYFNGTISGGTEANSVDLKVSLNFSAPPAGTQNSEFQLDLVNTPNVGTPNEQADFVYLPNVYPTSVFVISGTTYTLKLLGFRNVVGDGFLTSTATEFHVREGGTATAELWGVVTADIPVSISGVPEPSTWLAGLMASLGIAAARRYRRREG